MNTESWLEGILASLRDQHLERTLREVPASGGRVELDGRSALNFSANDYLNLAHHPVVVTLAEEMLRRYGAGATAARLVTGTLPPHTELEQRLAAYKGYPASLLFGSGYLCNAGVISSLMGRDDHVYADRLAHASILDAVTLSRAHLHRFQHNDMNHLDSLLKKRTGSGRHLVVTESLFSMDGDLAPLERMAEVCRDHEAMLMVDEAHATGIFGPSGSGLVSQYGLQDAVTLSMGTLSKALGGYGGFVACSETMKSFLVNRARSFIYTTAPPPAVVGAALGALDVLEKEPGLGPQLLENAKTFRERLQEAGLDTMKSESQVIPLLVGEASKAIALSEDLRKKGLLAIAIRPPTVPKGEARLRLSVSLAHTAEDLATAADLIIESAQRIL